MKKSLRGAHPESALFVISPPGFDVSAQPTKVKLGKSTVGTAEIAQTPLQHRARTDAIARRIVVESNRQLNQSLDMPSRWLIARQAAPDVFESLMRLEKLGSIEEAQPWLYFCAEARRFHSFRSV